MVSKDRIEDYIDKTERAINKIEETAPRESHLREIADDFLEMAVSYYSDAKYFFEEGKLDDAFACINYAHGWLDAGARLGLYDTAGDHDLFTLAD